MDDKKMEDALDTFVESLKREQEDGELVEHHNLKETSKPEENPGMEKLERITKRVVEKICIGEDVRVESDTRDMKISVYGQDLGMAIGRNGKNMEALEHIVNLIAARKKLVDKNVIIDIKDYRKKKAEKMKKTAIKMAKKAINEGKKIKLKPMGSYERKIIHDALANFKNIKTVSKNKEPYRRIVIYPVQEQG